MAAHFLLFDRKSGTNSAKSVELPIPLHKHCAQSNIWLARDEVLLTY